MKANLLPAVLALLLVTLPGCAKRETISDEERQQQQDAESRLDRLRWEVDSLVVKTGAATESLKVGMGVQIDSIRAQRDSAAQKVSELKTASKEAWEDVKEGTDRMLERLERTIGEARARLESRADTTGA